MIDSRTSLHLVDPELRPLFDLAHVASLTHQNLAAARQRFLPVPDVELTVIASDRLAIAGPAGAPEVQRHLYRPAAGAGSMPAILHMHGGGFVLGSAGARAADHRALARALGRVIASVDYRLAPETPFPGALEDVYLAGSAPVCGRVHLE